MGHLEHVDMREPACDEERIDSLLRIAGEQEPLRAERAEQHDRHVVDPRPRVGRRGRHRGPVRPEHAERDVVEHELIPRRQAPAAQAPAGQRGLERRVRGAGAGHSRLEQSPDPVAFDQQREAAHVVLVGVRDDDEIDPAVPRRDPRVEGHEEPIGVRTTVHEQSPTPRRLDEDRVALANVERDDVDPAVRPRRRRHHARCDNEREDDREGPDSTIRAQRTPVRAVRPGHRGAGCGGTIPPPRPGRPRPPRPEQAGDAPASAGDEEHGSGQPAERRARRRRKGHAREREVRSRLHEHDHQADDEGARQAEQRGEERRGAGTRQEAADEGKRAGRHRERHQRHDQEVEDGRQRSEPAERQQDDREGRRLRSQGDGEPLDDEPGQARQPRPEAGRDRRAPGEKPSGCGRGKLEPGIGDRRRAHHQEDHDGPGQGPHSRARAAGLARQQGDARHHRRAQHRRRGAREDRVERNRSDSRDGSPPPRPRHQERRDEPGDQGDVPAGDGHDVREAGRGEVRREVAIDPFPQPDEDAGRKAASRLGERPLQRISRVRPDPLHESVRIGCRGERSQRARGKRCRDAGPRKIGAVRAVGRRPQRAPDLDAVPGSHRRIAGGRNVDPQSGAFFQASGETLRPIEGCREGQDADRPRAVAGR
jgi:hypothetical protein